MKYSNIPGDRIIIIGKAIGSNIIHKTPATAINMGFLIKSFVDFFIRGK